MTKPTILPSNLTVIFDLDGTLVDTAPDIVASLNIAFVETGLNTIRFELLRPFVSLGARMMILEALRLSRLDFDDTQVDALLARLLQDYWKNIDRHSRPYDGVINLLGSLRAAKAVLGVCTNKRVAPSIELLTRLDMMKYFTAVLGSDSVPAHKPDPAHLVRTIDEAGGNRTRSVMVGDSGTDIATANAARIPVIAVDFGYTFEPPETLGADFLVSHFNEIPAALKQLFKSD